MKNSTIILKKRSCKSCGKESYIFSKGRCEQCTRVETFYAKEEKIQKEDDLQDLIGDLDILVSRWVRYSAPQKDGHIKCYTCNSWLPPAATDAGHYITRSCMYLRFDTARNIRPQCQICNRAKYGKAAEYGKNLEIELSGVTEILLEESRIVYKWTRDELRALISEYTQKLNYLNNV